MCPGFFAIELERCLVKRCHAKISASRCHARRRTACRINMWVAVKRRVSRRPRTVVLRAKPSRIIREASAFASLEYGFSRQRNLRIALSPHAPSRGGAHCIEIRVVGKQGRTACRIDLFHGFGSSPLSRPLKTTQRPPLVKDGGLISTRGRPQRSLGPQGRLTTRIEFLSNRVLTRQPCRLFPQA